VNQRGSSVSDIDLCAYLDGELAEERLTEIDACLARQPASRTKLDTWRRQDHQLRAAYGRIAQEPLPRQWNDRLLQAAATPGIRAIPKTSAKPVLGAPEPALRAPPAATRSQWRTLGLALLALPSVSRIAALGFGLTRHAAEAHAAFAPRASQWLDVRSADPAALAAATASAGLDVALPRAAVGMRQIGLRLTPGNGGLAALVLFDTNTAGPVSLFVTHGVRGAIPGLILREVGSLTIATFSVGGAAYALTGTAPRDQMTAWASAMRIGLLQPRSLRGS
jgi:anti-sigma factor RsiW